MSGTKKGGRKAARTNKERYGDGFYAVIGAIGGKNGNTGGFASDYEHLCDVIEGSHRLALCAGAKGGKKSKRGKAVPRGKS